jgi:hypothetical protein
MSINKVFNITDYTHSQTAIAQHITEQYSPSEEIINNLKLLHENIVIPLLNYLPDNLLITSGYRCERLNKAVGGVSNSDHVKGMAVDLNYFEGGAKNDQKIWDAVKHLGLKYRQMGNEHHLSWCHIAYNKDDLKMQIFVVN